MHTYKKIRNQSNITLIPMLGLITVTITALLSIVSFSKFSIINAPNFNTTTVFRPFSNQDKRLLLTVTMTNDDINIRGLDDQIGHSVAYKEMWIFNDSEIKETYVIQATQQNKKRFQEDRSITINSGKTSLLVSEREDIKLLATKLDSNNRVVLHNGVYNLQNDLMMNMKFVLLSIDSVSMGDTLINLNRYNNYQIKRRRIEYLTLQLMNMNSWEKMSTKNKEQIAELENQIAYLKNEIQLCNYYEIVHSKDLYKNSPIDLYDALNCKFIQIRNHFSGYSDLNRVTLVCARNISYDKFIKLLDIAKVAGFTSINCGQLRVKPF